MKNYCLLPFLILFIGCSPNTTKDAQNCKPTKKMFATAGSWFTNIVSSSLGNYHCVDIQPLMLEQISSQDMFKNILLDRYGIEIIYKTSWANSPDSDLKDNITIYSTKFSKDILPYGLYSAIPAGIDQSSLRGGTSKKVDSTLIGLKDTWLIWSTFDKNNDQSAIFDHELVFASFYRSLPNQEWRAPAAIYSLNAIDPKPYKIEIAPQGFMGIPVFENIVVAKFRSHNGDIEMFGSPTTNYPSSEKQFKKLVAWMKKEGVSLVSTKNDGRSSLLITDSRFGPLFLTLDKQGLKGVKGLKNVQDAQALVARWQR